MRLNFVGLVKRFLVAPEPYLDCTGTVRLTDSGNEVAARARDADLRKHCGDLGGHVKLTGGGLLGSELVNLDFDIAGDFAIVANCVHLVRTARHITDGSKFNVFGHQIFISIPFLLRFFLVTCTRVEVVKVNVSVLVAGCEPKIVFKPIDAPYSIDMASEHHLWGAVCSPEVIYEDFLLVVGSACEIVSAVGESDLHAAFDRH